MHLNQKGIKVLKTKKLLNIFIKKDSIVLFFSILDSSNNNLKILKKSLLQDNIQIYFIKNSFLKKILATFPGFTNIKHLLNGPILIGTILKKKDFYDFSLKLEKKYKLVILGCLLNQKLYNGSFIKKLTDLKREKVYYSLISTFLHKQHFLSLLLKNRIKESK